MNKETGWLIEQPQRFATPTQWLRAVEENGYGPGTKAYLTWDSHSELALRFARKQDAELFLLLNREWFPAIVTEHSWGLGS